MAKLTKNYKAALELIEAGKQYSIEEAVALVKKTHKVKFDGTVKVSFNLGLDTRQADQQLRGSIVLPHGTGKKVVVLAVTSRVDEAKAAGADFVGGKDMIEKIKTENWFGYDVIVATPEMMGELGKLGKLLGPKGLMPNPKSGTVGPDIAKLINEIKAGKVEFRTDKEANVHVKAGLTSFDDQKLAENIKTIVDTIVRVKPSAAKGHYIKNVVVSSVMGPGIKLAVEAH